MPLKLIKLKASPYWYVRGTVRGQPVFRTTGVEGRDAADALRVRWEQELIDASIYGAKAVKTFEEAAVSYLKRPGASMRERRFVIPIAEEIGRLRLMDVNQSAIDDYAQRFYPKAAPATIQRAIVTPITSVMNHAARRQWCGPVRFERPKAPPGRKRWASYDEAGRIVSAASGHLQPLLLFLVLTGARVAEAVELDWKDVDLDHAWVVFRVTKRNDEDRGVPLHPAVVDALRKLPHRAGAVFRPSRARAAYASKHRASGGHIKRGWQYALVRAGLAEWAKGTATASGFKLKWLADDITPHDLRHTFSTWLTMAGVHEQVRDELMGHASTGMGRRYSHVVRPALVEAVGRLPSVDVLPAPRENRVKSPSERAIFAFVPKALAS